MSEVKGWFDNLSLEEYFEAILNYDNRSGSRDPYTLLDHLTKRHEHALNSGLETQYDQAFNHLTSILRTRKP